MITNKQLKQLGFTFTSKRSAWLDIGECKAIVIGGILSFTVKSINPDDRQYIELNGCSLCRVVEIIDTYNKLPSWRQTPVDFNTVTIYPDGSFVCQYLR